VLFDEIEKAHPDVLNLLLQILEEGELSDGKGRKANFENTVVILTSNIGAEEVSRDNRLGFDIQVEDIDEDELDVAYEEMRDSLLESLKDELRPEILNRLDAIAVFRGLNEVDCLQISKNMIKELEAQMFENGIMLDLPSSMAKLVNKEGYSKEYGARNIRRKVQELIENPLADYLVNHKVKRPKHGVLNIEGKLKDDELSFKIKK
jgi:ATP-dependent Clp protease ATP-binding subunit ClpC